MALEVLMRMNVAKAGKALAKMEPVGQHSSPRSSVHHPWVRRLRKS